MSIACMILGESGSGKSTSLRNLDPDQTLLIQSVRKPLPFKSGAWKPVTRENPKGSVYVTDNSSHIVSALERTTKDLIVIDDAQYLMSNEFMRRVTDKEVGNAAFQKYNEIARSMWDVLMKASSLPSHKRVYILSHTNTDELGHTKIKTIGKLLDEKIVLEGLVTIVLRAMVRDGDYVFSTKNNGADTTKAPMGMFDEPFIPNDLHAVDEAICDFYGTTSATSA